jgi:1-acyl-sn-glycerol-3-phosphate acyltransferase
MKNIIHLLYQPYKFLVLFPYVAVSTLFFGVSAALLSVIINQKIGSLSGVVWARLIGWLTPMFFTIKGRGNINKDQSYVIVSNHQSQYDIILIYGWIGVDFKWVMKQELRKVPALGIACEKIGHIYINRSSTEAALNSINAAKKKIINGTSVLFFPEGTRSKDGKLMPFKKGAFKMAIDLGLPILPISINGTREILPSKSINLFPGKAGMTIHKPIDISEYNDSNLNELINKTMNLIESSIILK